jgi:hypothetical protein
MAPPLLYTQWPDGQKYNDPRFTLALDFLAPTDPNPQGLAPEYDSAEARAVHAAVARIQELIEGDATLRSLLETQMIVLYTQLEDRFGTL